LTINVFDANIATKEHYRNKNFNNLRVFSIKVYAYLFSAIAIWGSNTTLTCTLQLSYYYWQKRTDLGWSSLTQGGTKYGNVNSGSMTIYNVQINDGGRYRCGVNTNLEHVDVSVRGMYSR
jgi:hypothetical protein